MSPETDAERAERLGRELEEEQRRRTQAETELSRRPVYTEPFTPTPDTSKKGGGGGILSTFLIALVAAAVVCYAMISFMGVSKTDFTNNLGGIATTISGIQTDIQSFKDNPLQGPVGPAGAAGAAGAAGVGVSSATINTSGHLILTLTDGSTKDAGAVIGASVETPTETSIVTCELKAYSDLAIPATAGNYEYQFKATITNTGTQDLEDVVFIFSVSDISYYSSFVGTWGLTSDYLAWNLWGSSTIAPVFRSQLWGFSLDAGEKMTFYPKLTLMLTTAPTYSAMFDATMECEDYEVAD